MWVLSRGRRKPDDLSRMIGISFDVTERKRAEERFRQFAEHVMDVVWIVDPQTRTLEFLSPALEQVWGAPCDAFLQDENRWVEAVHPDDRARALDTFDRATLGAVAVEEYRIIRPDGAVRRIRNTVFPIRDEQGQIRRVGGIAQDITRQDGRFVYIINANETSRQSLSQMLWDRGYDVRSFPSGTAFLEVASALMPGCLVLDMREPEAGGLGIPRELKARQIGLPVIVLGEAHGDVTFAVQVMKAGAVDFLPSPYDQDQLLATLASAAADL